MIENSTSFQNISLLFPKICSFDNNILKIQRTIYFFQGFKLYIYIYIYIPSLFDIQFELFINGKKPIVIASEKKRFRTILLYTDNF